MKGMFCLFLMVLFACSDESTTDSVDLATAHYVIVGTVVDEKDASVALSDFQVVISLDAPYPYVDTVFTKTNGTFEWEEPVSTFGQDLVFSVTVTDADDNDGNQYAPYVTKISFLQDELDNDISWFLGEAKKEILIKMKKK